MARLAAASAALERRGDAIVPLEVQRLEQVDDLPWILGAFLAVIGLLGIVYVTLVGVRRRARDLAVLKTVGFRRSQIVTTVATQASLLGVVGLLVGIPLGLLLGRFVWDRIAHGAGLGSTVAAPVAWWSLSLSSASSS